jgi:dimethylglycine dehydrogenase
MSAHEVLGRGRHAAGFGHELFPDDLERIEENMLRAIARVPAVGTAGIKRVINGPMIWSPDSAALFGPVPELTQLFLLQRHHPRLFAVGRHGQAAAEWMIEGEPSLDMFGWDLARFGPGRARISPGRACRPVRHRFKIHFPNEERAAGRPVRTRPAYEMQKDMGRSSAWPLAGNIRCGSPPRASHPGNLRLHRQNWWAPVGREARMLRERAGIIDISNFARYRVAGPGAEAWLNALSPTGCRARSGGPA